MHAYACQTDTRPSIRYMALNIFQIIQLPIL